MTTSPPNKLAQGEEAVTAAPRDETPGQRRCRDGSDLPGRPGQTGTLEGFCSSDQGRATKDELEGKPEVALGPVSPD